MYIKYYTNEQKAFGQDDTTGVDIEASLHYLLDHIEATLRAAYPDASIETGIDLGGLDTDADGEQDRIMGIIEKAWGGSHGWVIMHGNVPEETCPECGSVLERQYVEEGPEERLNTYWTACPECGWPTWPADNYFSPNSPDPDYTPDCS